MFRIRCSKITEIMATPKNGELISKGAQTHCRKWLHEQVYGVGKEAISKYIMKGNATEEESIRIMAEYFDLPLVKNTVRYMDEEIEGEPDVEYKNIIYDAKSSWDHMTFPLLYDHLPNKEYGDQMQGYMAITGADMAYVVYVLNDTPEELLSGQEPITYSDLPLSLRVKPFLVKRDDDRIDYIRNRVAACNEWLWENYGDKFSKYLI